MSNDELNDADGADRDCEDCGWFPCRCNEKSEPKFYTVAIVMTDRLYGGPEEGGWYYDDYEPLPEFAFMTKIVKTKEEAFSVRDELENYIEQEKLNDGRRPISSVLSEGQYTTYIYEGEYPCYKPEARPHYE